MEKIKEIVQCTVIYLVKLWFELVQYGDTTWSHDDGNEGYDFHYDVFQMKIFNTK